VELEDMSARGLLHELVSFHHRRLAHWLPHVVLKNQKLGKLPKYIVPRTDRMYFHNTCLKIRDQNVLSKGDALGVALGVRFHLICDPLTSAERRYQDIPFYI
jgi:hypothetical protein